MLLVLDAFSFFQSVSIIPTESRMVTLLQLPRVVELEAGPSRSLELTAGSSRIVELTQAVRVVELVR